MKSTPLGIVLFVITAACTSDPAMGTTDGGTLDGCPALPPSPTAIGEIQLGATYPSPAGGALVDGTYYLTRFEIYSPAIADAHMRRNRLDLASGRLVSVNQSDTGPIAIKGGTVASTGASLTIELDCPTAATAAIPYTATGNELWILDSSEPNVQVYTRQ